MSDLEVMEQEKKKKCIRFWNWRLKAGEILLKHGAEISRVEETIDRICKKFLIETVDAFVLSNGIFITASNNEHEVFARVRAI